jgi:hypothetical protein
VFVVAPSLHSLVHKPKMWTFVGQMRDLDEYRLTSSSVNKYTAIPPEDLTPPSAFFLTESTKKDDPLDKVDWIPCLERAEKSRHTHLFAKPLYCTPPLPLPPARHPRRILPRLGISKRAEMPWGQVGVFFTAAEGDFFFVHSYKRGT